MPSNNRSREHQIPSLQLLKKATLTVFPPSSDQIKKTNLRLQFIYTQTPIHTPKKQNKTKKQGSRFTKDHLNHENLNCGPKITTNHYETSKQTPSTMQNIKKHQPGIKLDQKSKKWIDFGTKTRTKERKSRKPQDLRNVDDLVSIRGSARVSTLLRLVPINQNSKLLRERERERERNKVEKGDTFLFF